MRYLLSLLGLFLFSFPAIAQKEGNIWYFGEKAGLNFNSGFPVPLTDGAMITDEGCASISDRKGNLLFYTDGINVWTRAHKVMPNGNDLYGHPSSTQSAVIIPKPLDPNIFYIFTIDAETGARGMRYSVVDMKQNAGFGDVIFRNVGLHSPACEKLTAVLHANKKDVWVIAHDWNSQNYVVYKVTETGVKTSPLVSKTGIVHGGDVQNASGYLKVSPGGNYLCAAIKGNGTSSNYQVFDFDNATGEVKFMFGGGLASAAYYGVEFSPDNSKLYLTTGSGIEQVDMSSGTVTRIDNEGACSALQLGPDQKIYVSRTGKNELGVIRLPNEKGLGCDYIRNGITLPSGYCRQGLPTFIQSYFEPFSGIRYGAACKGQPVKFEGKSNIEPTDWKWDFGDPASGAANYSAVQNPEHTYQFSGTYKVQLVIRIEGVYDTVTNEITVFETPKVDLGKDLVKCIEDKVKLDAQNPGMKYQWSSGDTTQTMTPKKSGTYWVKVSNGLCSGSDTVSITLIDTAGVTIGKDTLACKGDTIVLTSSVPQARHVWSTGDTTPSIKVHQSATIVAFTIIGSCLMRDTVNVTFIDPPHVDLGETRMICEGDSLELDAGNPGAKYVWSTGQTTQKIKVGIGGKYWISVHGGGCRSSDTLKLLHCRANVYLPNVFTPNGDKLNDRFRVFGTDIARGSLTITNRWGEKVWQSDDIFTGWDGTFKGGKCPDGVYLWSLLFWEYEGEVLYPRELRGMMNLVRQ